MAGTSGVEKAWFSVCIEADLIAKKRELIELQLKEVFADVIGKLSNDDENVTFEVFVGPSADRVDVKVLNYSEVRVLYDFGYRFIKFQLRDTLDAEALTTSVPRRNAFDVLKAAGQAETHMPPSRKGKKSSDKFYNDMLDILSSSLDVGFKYSQVDTLGKKVIGTLYSCLWYIKPHDVKLAERAIHIPKPFSTLTGYMNYRDAHKALPRISAEVLKKHIDDLSDVLILTYTGRKPKLFQSVEGLVEALKRYYNTFVKQQIRSSERHASTVPLRSNDNNFTLKTVASVTNVSHKYKELNDEILSKNLYEPVWLNDLPTIAADRYEKRHWVEGIGLGCHIQIYSYEHGNNFGTYRFVWKVPEFPEDRSEDAVLRVVSNIHQALPSYHTRSVTKLFFERYGKLATISKSVLRNMYTFLTEAQLPDSSASVEIDHRLRFVLQADDPDILWDLIKLNMNPGSTRFDAFGEELNHYFEENTTVVHERRHEQYLYLPVAVSVEDLVSTVTQCLTQNTPIPSTEWVRLQFWPTNSTTDGAYHHTGRLNIKFAVQTRQIRGSHEDSQFCYHQLKLMKEFAERSRDDLLLFWLDDKAAYWGSG